MRATARDGFSYPRYICRRIARMMPPIVVTIALTAFATYIAAPSLLPKVQQDALPSALFLSNWFYIFRNVSYFAAAGLPSPLTHLWFCAVTMQFYLVWPVILMALYSKTRSRNTAIGITIAFALASTAAMVHMFNPTADTSRVYYGTDARAAELLCGALAAIAAQKQNKFWEMHDALFQVTTWTPATIEEIAQKTGLNMERFRADISSPETQMQLAKDKSDAQNADVSATPSLFINGRPVRERSPMALQAMIDEAFALAKGSK